MTQTFAAHFLAENENFSGAPIYKATEFNKLDPEFKKIYKDAWAPLVELSRVMNTVYRFCNTRASS